MRRIATQDRAAYASQRRQDQDDILRCTMRGDLDQLRSILTRRQVTYGESDDLTTTHLLVAATSSNQPEVVEFLLSIGYSVDEPGGRWERTGYSNPLRLRPLHIAARAGNESLCAILMDAGADRDILADWPGSLALPGIRIIDLLSEHQPPSPNVEDV